MKYIVAISLLFLLSACGTIKTINPEKNRVEIKYKGKSSYCTQIPRIYSGVIYNICHLYGEPSSSISSPSSENDISLLFLDSVISVASDSVVLPYTLYRQITIGSIEVD